MNMLNFHITRDMNSNHADYPGGVLVVDEVNVTKRGVNFRVRGYADATAFDSVKDEEQGYDKRSYVYEKHHSTSIPASFEPDLFGQMEQHLIDVNEYPGAAKA
jgi:hypothetical protein